MTQRKLTEGLTVAATGASLAAGVAAALTSSSRIFDLAVPTSAISLSGLVGFAIGLLAGWLAKDWILRKAEKSASQVAST